MDSSWEHLTDSESLLEWERINIFNQGLQNLKALVNQQCIMHRHFVMPQRNRILPIREHLFSVPQDPKCIFRYQI